MYNPLDMTGKRILVTGASSGIGRACAVMLSRLGAQLVLLGRNEARLCETELLLKGASHQVQLFDLEELGEIKNLTALTGARERKISGIVHAAGISPVLPLGATTPKVLENTMRVNHLAFVELARCFTKKMYFSDSGGCIVAISSIASTVGWPGGSAYCSSKAALDSFVRVAALELADKKIRANTVLPSFIATPMLKVDDSNNFVDYSSERMKKVQPLGLGEPDDVAHAVAFLLSDAAKFITGTNLVVDGGYLAQ